MDDLFLKIIRGDIPSAKLYEDEHAYAFLDINPNNKGHALVVPKEHYRNIFDIESKTFAHMAEVAVKLARAIREATGADGVNILMNNEAAAGQEIFHAHIHIIPRFLNDGVFSKAQHTSYDGDEILEMAEKIKAAFSAA